MLGFFLQKALGNQQREIDVLVPGCFEAFVKRALQRFPNSIAIRFDHHAAFYDFRRFGHVALENNVLIPRSEVLGAWSDPGFCHSSNFRLSPFQKLLLADKIESN